MRAGLAAAPRLQYRGAGDLSPVPNPIGGARIRAIRRDRPALQLPGSRSRPLDHDLVSSLPADSDRLLHRAGVARVRRRALRAGTCGGAVTASAPAH
jgi:hypothetical protein